MRHLLAIAIGFAATVALGDEFSISQFGINSKGLGLDGTGIQIGQAEGASLDIDDGGRSGKAGYDDVAHSAANTFPAGVYNQNDSGQALNNFHVSKHATKVAGVMIGKAMPAKYEGVAPNAQLHSISIDGNMTDDTLSASALNRLALLNNKAIRAINISGGRSLQGPVEQPDGNSYIAQFIDWSARRQNILYVVAWGNEEANPPLRTPADEYNSIVVGASESIHASNNRAAYFRNATQGDPIGRTGIDILAPGSGIFVRGVKEDGSAENEEEQVFGTSYAAPHVTGAVALLQQYVKQKIDMVPSPPGFNFKAQRQEVMKAAILNSADKMVNVHGSTHTIFDRQGNDWEHSEAYTSRTIPFDDQMGVGEIDVKRAVQQLAPGIQSPGAVPMIGWDYGAEGGEYLLSSPVAADQYIAITLVWDRRMETPDGNNWFFGDVFSGHGVANLDLFLMPQNSMNTADAVWSSESTENNEEHIFYKFKAGEAGNYKIVVQHSAGDIGNPLAVTSYGLAWWYGTAPPLTTAGDYSGDGKVDGADYVLWRKDPASYGGDPGGYDAWRANFGVGSGSGASLAPVPEPSPVVLVFVGFFLYSPKRRGA